MLFTDDTDNVLAVCQYGFGATKTNYIGFWHTRLLWLSMRTRMLFTDDANNVIAVCQYGFGVTKTNYMGFWHTRLGTNSTKF